MKKLQNSHAGALDTFVRLQVLRSQQCSRIERAAVKVT